MHILSTKKYEVDPYFNLEVLSINNQSIQNFPPIHKGYIFHFSVGENTLDNLDQTFQLSLANSWKLYSPGSLNILEKKLEQFKGIFLENKNLFVEFVDQFGYLVLFIVEGKDGYELVISSDSFGVDQIVPLVYDYAQE